MVLEFCKKHAVAIGVLMAFACFLRDQIWAALVTLHGATITLRDAIAAAVVWAKEWRASLQEAKKERLRLEQLPPCPELVGRTGDLKELLALDPSVPVVIDGMGGMGKTALALVLAHEWKKQGRFPDGQLFLEAGGARNVNVPTSPPESRSPPVSTEWLMRQVLTKLRPSGQLRDDFEALKAQYRDALPKRAYSLSSIMRGIRHRLKPCVLQLAVR